MHKCSAQISSLIDLLVWSLIYSNTVMQGNAVKCCFVAARCCLISEYLLTCKLECPQKVSFIPISSYAWHQNEKQLYWLSIHVNVAIINECGGGKKGEKRGSVFSVSSVLPPLQSVHVSHIVRSALWRPSGLLE